MYISVAEKLRILMNRKGVTMGALAEATGQTRQNLSNKFKRGNFTEKDIVQFAKVIGYEVEIRFLDENGDGF